MINNLQVKRTETYNLICQFHLILVQQVFNSRDFLFSMEQRNL